MPFLCERKNGVALAICVQPKASKNRIMAVYGNALKVGITAPPVDGKANAAIISFFAKLLGVPKSAITVTSGLQSRRKKILISRISSKAVREIIGGLLD